MKNFKKNFLIVLVTTIMSITLYIIFSHQFDWFLREDARFLIIVKTLFAIFDMGVAVALFKD